MRRLKELWLEFNIRLYFLLLSLGLAGLMVPKSAYAGNVLDEMSDTVKDFIKKIEDLTRISLYFGVGLAAIGLPLLIGIKTAYVNYQRQEQQPGGRINWASVIAHGMGAFVASAMLAAVLIAVLDKLTGGNFTSKAWEWLTGSSSSTTPSNSGG